MFTVLIAVDAMTSQITNKMLHGAFNFMMRYRIVVPKPDPDIVIVDINEAVALASGRAGTGRMVSATGIRGLSEEEACFRPVGGDSEKDRSNQALACRRRQVTAQACTGHRQGRCTPLSTDASLTEQSQSVVIPAAFTTFVHRS